MQTPSPPAVPLAAPRLRREDAHKAEAHRAAYAAFLGIDVAQVRVVCTDTGGAFGAKAIPY